jgi:glycerol uptake facilitator-like aquaporin
VARAHHVRVAGVSVLYHVRTGTGQWIGEIIATFGLLAIIWGCRAHPAAVTAFAVAAYITGAYWFTASTSFANPAVTLARALTDTFAGIRPTDAPAFILAQLVGLTFAWPLLRRLGVVVGCLTTSHIGAPGSTADTRAATLESGADRQ